MSQSRNRSMSTYNREGSGARAVPADGNKPGFMTNARALDGKSSNKISKELRCELENALVGLCDVWFDEIKPYLVKNNLKVHTGGALNENDYGDLEMAGDRSGANRGDHPRDLDPGAVSDQRPSCATFSPTRRVESSAPCRRRPAPCHPMPLTPSEFHNLLKSISRNQKTAKTRRKASQKEPKSPPLPTQPSANIAVRYPRCTACGFVSSQTSQSPLRPQSNGTLPCMSHARQLLHTNNLLVSRAQYSSFQTTKLYTANKRLSTIDSVDELEPQTEAVKSGTDFTRTQINIKIPTANFTSCSTTYPPQFAKRVGTLPKHTAQESQPLRSTGTSPARPHTLSPPSFPTAKSPKNKRPVSPSNRTIAESGAVLAPWLRRTSENNWLAKRRDEIRRAKRNSQMFNNNVRPMTNKTILIPAKHEAKYQLGDKSPLFPKDLISLIGEKYDTRLKVLYQNPKGEDAYPSLMCLTGKTLSTTKSSWK